MTQVGHDDNLQIRRETYDKPVSVVAVVCVAVGGVRR